MEEWKRGNREDERTVSEKTGNAMIRGEECRGNASSCRRGPMVVDRVGFHSNFGAFKRSRHTKTLTRLAITNEFPFNPTYESERGKGICYRAPYSVA